MKITEYILGAVIGTKTEGIGKAKARVDIRVECPVNVSEEEVVEALETSLVFFRGKAARDIAKYLVESRKHPKRVFDRENYRNAINEDRKMLDKIEESDDIEYLRTEARDNFHTRLWLEEQLDNLAKQLEDKEK